MSEREFGKIEYKKIDNKSDVSVNVEIQGGLFEVKEISKVALRIKLGKFTFSEDKEYSIVLQVRTNDDGRCVYFKGTIKGDEINVTQKEDEEAFNRIVEFIFNTNVSFNIPGIHPLEGFDKYEKIKRKARNIFRIFLGSSIIALVAFLILMNFIVPKWLTETVDASVVSQGFSVPIPEKSGFKIEIFPNEGELILKGGKIAKYQSNKALEELEIEKENVKMDIQVAFDYEIQKLDGELGLLDVEIGTLERKKEGILKSSNKTITSEKRGRLYDIDFQKDNIVLSFLYPNQKGKVLALIPISDEKFEITKFNEGSFEYNGKEYNLNIGQTSISGTKEYFGLKDTALRNSAYIYVECDIVESFNLELGTVLDLKLKAPWYNTRNIKGYFVKTGYKVILPNKQGRLFPSIKVGDFVDEGNVIAYEIDERLEDLAEIESELDILIQKKSNIFLRKDSLRRQLKLDLKRIEVQHFKLAEALKKDLQIFSPESGIFYKVENEKNGEKVVKFFSVDSNNKIIPNLVLALIKQKKEIPYNGKGWLDINGRKVEGRFHFISREDIHHYFGAPKVSNGESILIFSPSSDIGIKKGSPIRLYLEKNQKNWRITRYILRIYDLQKSIINWILGGHTRKAAGGIENPCCFLFFIIFL